MNKKKEDHTFHARLSWEVGAHTMVISTCAATYISEQYLGGWRSQVGQERG